MMDAAPTPTAGASHPIRVWAGRPETLLLLMAAAVPLAWSTWIALLDNFAIERAGFRGEDIGILHSIREIPGFLAFLVVYLLLFLREQTLAILALFVTGAGTAVSGFFPTTMGLWTTTMIMSMGFHYFYAVKTSLAMQWVAKERAPLVFGRIRAAEAIGALIVYGVILVAWRALGLDYAWIYLIGGGATALIAIYCWVAYPLFPVATEQNKGVVLRGRYWLYYALTFMGGARRQIFIVFAGFMMVDKFGLEVHAIAAILIANQVVTMVCAPQIGRLIGRWGERRALMLEYLGLIGVFTAYAFVDTEWLAIAIYILDHIFFAMAIAIETYFQKIADPRDIAPTASVGFTINHIAAVGMPVMLGPVYDWNMSAVFLVGAGLAVVSFLLALLVPRHPTAGHQTALRPTLKAASPAA